MSFIDHKAKTTKAEIDALLAELENPSIALLNKRVAELDKAQTVLLICQSGVRANRAASEFRRAGFSDVYVLSGGYIEWQSQGLPTAA